MLTVDIEAPDLRPFAEEVEGLGPALGDFQAASRQAGTMVLGDVRPPIRTGTLAATVEAVPEGLGFALRAGGPRAPYGPIVHARDPFLTRALTGREDDVLDIYLGHVEDTLNTITT